MSSSSPASLLCARGSFGLQTVTQMGSDLKWQQTEEMGPHEKSKSVKAMCFSPCGSILAWSNGETVEVTDSSTGFTRPVCSLAAARANFLCFSPTGSILATWEVFSVKQGQDAKPNLNLWESKTGKHLAGFVSKKASSWQPQWTADETLCFLRSLNNEVVVYKDGDFSTVDKRLSIAKMTSFSASPNSKSVYPIVCFVPGQKGGPGFGKLYNYPSFNAEKDVVANKSFFQSDM
jgi:translation initiation factor 2A